MADVCLEAFAINEAINIESLKNKICDLIDGFIKKLKGLGDKIVGIFDKIFKKAEPLDDAYQKFLKNPDKYTVAGEFKIYDKRLRDSNFCSGIGDAMFDIFDSRLTEIEHGKIPETEIEEDIADIYKSKLGVDMKKASSASLEMDVHTQLSRGKVDAKTAVKSPCYEGLSLSFLRSYTDSYKKWYNAACDRSAKMKERVKKFPAEKVTEAFAKEFSGNWSFTFKAVSIGSQDSAMYINTATSLMEAILTGVVG